MCSLLVGLLVLSGGVPTAAVAQDGPLSQCDVTAQEALATQQTAETRHRSLQELARTDGVQISESVLESVGYQLDQGDLAVQTERYCEARDHYRTVIDQAEVALIRGNVERARLQLDAADAHLQELHDRGYVSLRVTRLDERIESQRTRLEDVDTLADARAARENARQLSSDVDDLPGPNLVGAVRFARSPLGIVAGIVLVLAVGLIGYVIGRVRSPTVPSRESEETGDQQEDIM